MTVLDPACGDGRFLLAARVALAARGVGSRLVGVDIDADAVASARLALGPDAEIRHDDSLTRDWADEAFDLVIGNPPFLSQMAASTSRGGRSSHGGGAYADAAAEFLALAVRLARPDGGRVALVLPLSVTATRDAGPIRAAVLESADLEWFWWSPTSVFDAEVRTCAVVLGRPPGTIARVERVRGVDFIPDGMLDHGGLRSDHGSSGTWSALVAHHLGFAEAPSLASDGRCLGDIAVVTADFRDEYYGLVGAVGDFASGPPLVTSGLIDPARCWWGERSVRFAKSRFAAPRVDIAVLSGPMQAWVRSRLVPKVLIGSQTRVIEAVADPGGEWIPGVPVISVIPHDPSDVALVEAVLTSPAASAWLAHRSAGSGMAAHALRVSAAVLAQLPLPTGSLDPAVGALKRGRHEAHGPGLDALVECGRAVDRAYGIADDLILDSWVDRLPTRS